MPRTLAVIMAGGGGTRLWPASVPARPKQLLDPFLAADGPGGLLAQTAARVAPLVPPADVWVVTTADQVEGVCAALPHVPRAQIIAEPFGRNTAPAIALAVRHLARALGPELGDAVVLALPADHHVRDESRFVALLRGAIAHAAAAHTIVTLGIAATRPETGFGYIERADARCAAVAGDGDVPVFPALRFVEKPDAATAAQFVAAGTFAWNAGIFVMPARRIAAELAQRCPAAWNALEPVATRDVPPAELAAAYAQIPSAPIDVAVMERQADLRMVPADVGWTDLGAWSAVAELLAKDPRGNAVAADARGRVTLLDSDGCLVWSEGADVGVIGLRDVAVVASGGRVLVMPLAQAQAVKALVERRTRDDEGA